MKLVRLSTALFAVIIVSHVGAASAANADDAQCDKLEHDFQQELRGGGTGQGLVEALGAMSPEHHVPGSLGLPCPSKCEQVESDFHEALLKEPHLDRSQKLTRWRLHILGDCPKQRDERARKEKEKRDNEARYPQPPPPRRLTLQEVTQRNIENLVHDETGGDSWGTAAIAVLRNRYAGGQAGGMDAQIAQLGRFMAAQLGVGSCTRHFYNKTDHDWAVALIYAGTCHLDGQPAGNDAICLVPPHGTVELDYYNNAETSHRAKIALVGTPPPPIQGYAATFKLNIVGCKIEHNGATGEISVNDPADGDVNSLW
jgi:hypothetical protein